MTDFQARATREGRLSLETVKPFLEGCGFTIESSPYQPPDIKLKVNVLCLDATDKPWFFDVSGAFTSARAGLVRTDTVYKAMGRTAALVAKGYRPIVFVTTNLPRPDTAGDQAIRAPGHQLVHDVILSLSHEGRARLAAYARGEHRDVPLPGFWTPKQVYGSALRSNGPHGEQASLPLKLTGDPLGEVVTNYDVADMPYRVKVIIPSEDRNGDRLSSGRRKRAASRVQELLSEVGGGCTSQQAAGHWADPFGGTADEEVLVMEMYSRVEPPTPVVEEIVELVMDTLDQNTAALVLGDRMLQFSR